MTFRVSGIDAALALADKLRQDPTNLPAARLLKGAVYVAAGRPADAAAADAAETRAVAPFGALVIAEARALAAAGRIDDARARLADWLASQPDPTVADALATLEIGEKRMDAAAAALKQVLAMRPDDPVALNNLAWVYQQQHDPKAVTLARRAYLIAPAGQTADTLGWILTRQGQPAIGLLLLRQAAARLTRDPSVYLPPRRGAGRHRQAAGRQPDARRRPVLENQLRRARRRAGAAAEARGRGYADAMRRRAGGLLALLLTLLAPPAVAQAEWRRFEVILWHDHGPAARLGAVRLGVTAALLWGQRDGVDAAALRRQAAALRADGLGCYVENIATDFYAAYHRWRPDHPVTWAFDQVRALHRRDPADPSCLAAPPEPLRPRLARHHRGPAARACRRAGTVRAALRQPGRRDRHRRSRRRLGFRPFARSRWPGCARGCAGNTPRSRR